MKKIILSIFFCLFSFAQVGAYDYLPVDEVFSDIKKDYKYYNEVQELYNRGILFPDADGKLRPEKLLERDEFVGISMEVICRKCIQPNVEVEFLTKYTGKTVYFDINETNKYFYCVAEADDKSYVRGYVAGDICEDGTKKTGERPFCPNNTTTREEAYAVIMRNSKIWTIEQNEQMLQSIINGEETENLSSDVSPKNGDGTPYTFYGYFKKALSYQLIEYDENGKQKIYKLLDPKDNKISPKELITKEEFIYLAYIALKGNSCRDTTVKDDIALKMKIHEKTCKESDKNCKLSDLQDPVDTYDFRPIVETTCKEGVKHPEGYIWRFINLTNGAQFYRYGRYIENEKLSQNGQRRIYLRVIDNCNQTAEVYSTIYVDDEKTLNVSIIADPIIGYAPLLVDYEGIVTGGTSPYGYDWSFGDGKKGIGKFTNNIFEKKGLYKTKLIGTDSEGRSGEATVLIKVLERDCKLDRDRDGVNDCDDKCPLVNGPAVNQGCPVFEPRCGANCACEPGYTCDITDPLTCPLKGTCKPIIDKRNCLYDSSKDLITGNVTCNSCPCNQFVDFLSNLRRCDIIFPAITSPDSKEIYSKGGIYTITK